MKILQINTTVNTGSTGRIVEAIGQMAIRQGHESYIAMGRGQQQSASHRIRIGNQWDIYWHGIVTRLFDRHGLSSKQATVNFLGRWQYQPPDIIGLHNIHGYYLHYPTLFSFIKQHHTPVIWTFHDCWPFTGHCAHFESVDCEKWKTHCKECPQQRAYPASFRDRSFQNFENKRSAFQGVEQLQVVTPSHWLARLTKQSFLQEYPVHVIHNGIDLNVFKPLDFTRKKMVLGVASIWSASKGLNDFKRLRQCLQGDWQIVLIGLSNKQIRGLPSGITGIARTESVDELVQWYNRASVFINPTYSDNFPTTNIEALACGTPVITYDTGGSPEAVDENTGRVVQKGDIIGLVNAIKEIRQMDQGGLVKNCRLRAEKYFNQLDRYNEYVRLYETLVEELR